MRSPQCFTGRNLLSYDFKLARTSKLSNFGNCFESMTFVLSITGDLSKASIRNSSLQVCHIICEARSCMNNSAVLVSKRVILFKHFGRERTVFSSRSLHHRPVLSCSTARSNVFRKSGHLARDKYTTREPQVDQLYYREFRK